MYIVNNSETIGIYINKNGTILNGCTPETRNELLLSIENEELIEIMVVKIISVVWFIYARELFVRNSVEYWIVKLDSYT